MLSCNLHLPCLAHAAKEDCRSSSSVAESAGAIRPLPLAALAVATVLHAGIGG